MGPSCVPIFKKIWGGEDFFVDLVWNDPCVFNVRPRHTIVCRVAQENRVHAIGVSILTGRTKSWFSRMLSSMMPRLSGTKFTVELLSIQGTILAIVAKIKSVSLKIILTEQSYNYILITETLTFKWKKDSIYHGSNLQTLLIISSV